MLYAISKGTNMRVTMNKRKHTLSFTATDEEMRAFKKLVRKVEDDHDGQRWSMSDFLREWLFIPFIDSLSNPEDLPSDSYMRRPESPKEDPLTDPSSNPPSEKEDPSNEIVSKNSSEQQSEPSSKYSFNLDDL